MAQLHDFKAALFRALGHPLRLRILDLLRSGPETVGELAESLGVDLSQVSQQLAVMRTHQMVSTRKQGTAVWYSAADPLLFDLLDTARVLFENQVTDLTSALRDDRAPDRLLPSSTEQPGEAPVIGRDPV